MNFKENKYAIIRDLIPKKFCKEFVKYTEQIEETGTHDEQVPGAKSFYGDKKAEALMLYAKDKLEQVTGEELLPTYAYFRIYKPGDELLVHTDRPACEVSATVCIGYKGKPWIISLLDANDDVQDVSLEQGDGLTYLGMEVEHWREKYVCGTKQVNVFLHYVKKEGEHAKEVYDGREKTNAEECWLE